MWGRSTWGRYSKDEHATDFSGYDYRVTAEPQVPGFRVLHVQDGFARMRLLEMQRTPQIYVHQRVATPATDASENGGAASST